MNQKRIGVYVGVDPTAPSLHVGHLLPFMALFWMYIHGYPVTLLVSRIRETPDDVLAQKKKNRLEVQHPKLVIQQVGIPLETD